MGRLTDNDKKFMGITYGKMSWKTFRLVFSSGSPENEREYRNEISLYLKGYAFRVYTPNIIKPHQIKHIAQYWDEETIKRMGRNYYYEYFPKDYGFNWDDDYFQIFHGAQTHSSTDTKAKFYSLPWKQWRHVRTSIYDPDGGLWWDNVSGSSPKRMNDTWFEMKKSCPKSVFLVYDYDGVEVKATCHISEMQWEYGEGWFKWLRFFKKPMIKRTLDIEFDKEVGADKGSWKGGLIGTGIVMLPNESPLGAFKRFCHNDIRSKNGNSKLKFKGEIDE